MLVSSRATVEDSGARLLREVWALTALGILTVTLRVIAKIKIGKFAFDDILMILALLCAVVGSSFITVGIQHGFGQHVWDIKPQVPKVIMYDYLAQTFGIAGGTLGRIAFIVFVVRLLGTRRLYRVILWMLVGLQLVTNFVLIIILFVQCPGHASAIWAPSGKDNCWDVRVQAYYGYYQGAFNSATDLYLATFSTFIFWNLNLKFRAKLGLVTLLGLGIFAMIASIIKVAQTRVFAHPDDDPTVATVSYDRWLFIEAYLVIITASIPCIRSLLRSFEDRYPASGRSVYELHSPYAGTSAPNSRRMTPNIPGKTEARISDGNESIEEILRWNTTDMEHLQEQAASTKATHIYV
ncbi:hypothetical protein N7541_005316 [Penicillium brevicompactum]|uniref:Rhodopsin domain-containing protein n=1 Tax=Penicillium brevicompactum TaxID=5074 RepID=A0A9W9RDC2_PENBR|nr:hypothetical protein N7541_005316 [Penicillium brevicompactum]